MLRQIARACGLRRHNQSSPLTIAALRDRVYKLMNNRISPVVAALFVLPLLSFAPAYAQQAQAPSTQPPKEPTTLDVQGGKIRVVPVATGLFHPWSLAFPDAHTILVTERNGRLRMIRDGVLNPDP